MKIGAVGYNYEHRDEFVMDRPDGTGCYLLLLIKEPSIFIINGTQHKVAKNSFVLFLPSTPYKYYADGEVYTDDWMYLNEEDGDVQRLADLDIPLDVPTQVLNIEELSQLVRIIAFEHHSKYTYTQEILSHYLDIFLLKLSRAVCTDMDMGNQILSEKYQTLFHLRNRIFAMPESIPDVDGMAEQTGMSRSGFQHLYKKTFGVSVMHDVINSRIERAKKLLRCTNLSIREIASNCGYQNEYSFMRCFKERVGMTPTEYRSCV